jgi:hypothetical protein
MATIKNKGIKMIKINSNKLASFIELFESIKLILDKFQKSNSIDILKDRLTCFIEDARKYQSYNLKEFIDFLSEFTSLMISTGNQKKYIEKIALLAIIPPDASSICDRLGISSDIGKYFYDNWETYVENKNENIKGLIFFHYMEKYSKIMSKDIKLIYLVNQIKNDKYLFSSYGLDMKRILIMWLCEDAISDKKIRMEFLEHFIDDDVLRMQFSLEFAGIKLNRNSK